MIFAYESTLLVVFYLIAFLCAYFCFFVLLFGKYCFKAIFGKIYFQYFRLQSYHKDISVNNLDCNRITKKLDNPNIPTLVAQKDLKIYICYFTNNIGIFQLSLWLFLEFFETFVWFFLLYFFWGGSVVWDFRILPCITPWNV